MIDYIKGIIVELSPAELVLETNNIGYRILISLQTFHDLQEKKEAKVFIHHYMREDLQQFYGFSSKDERELFELLISVSGIGVSSARMMLSSLSAEEIRHAIISEDIARIKSVKGIGLKSAQRLILELKDKVVSGNGADNSTLEGFVEKSEVIEEASRALIMLGFAKPNVTKAIKTIVTAKPNAKVEEIIKEALRMM